MADNSKGSIRLDNPPEDVKRIILAEQARLRVKKKSGVFSQECTVYAIIRAWSASRSQIQLPSWE
ncbi:MAG TPA: hypothetical protein VEY71_07035 [Chitinophagales bacterium]|nr:hypothetical protein [Chitinophagales bacterium]